KILPVIPAVLLHTRVRDRRPVPAHRVEARFAEDFLVSGVRVVEVLDLERVGSLQEGKPVRHAFFDRLPIRRLQAALRHVDRDARPELLSMPTSRPATGQPGGAERASGPSSSASSSANSSARLLWAECRTVTT